MSRLSHLSTLCLLTLALSACSTLPMPGSGPSPEQTTYIQQKTLSPFEDPVQVAHALGGEVVFWHPESRSLLVGLKTSALLKQSTSGTLEPDQGVVQVPESTIYANGPVLWGDGPVLWGDGPVLWGDGPVLWGDGLYGPVPENTASWSQLGLKEAQLSTPSAGNGITVAVLDSGLDFQHPAFPSQVLTSQNAWKDFVDNDKLPQEVGVPGNTGYGHGTAVSSIVLQMAPRVKLLPVRVLNSDGKGDLSDLVRGIYHVVDRGAQIINLSVGMPEKSAALQAALSYAASKNVLVVSSAGNSNLYGLNYPAGYSGSNPMVVSVGSVQTTLQKSIFSNYHESLTLSALGENIYVAYPGGLKSRGYGTSFAAPQVAGTLALALGQNANLSSSSAVQALKNSATPLNPDNPNFQNQLGAGLLNVHTFVETTRP